MNQQRRPLVLLGPLLLLAVASGVVLTPVLLAP